MWRMTTVDIFLNQTIAKAIIDQSQFLAHDAFKCQHLFTNSLNMI